MRAGGVKASVSVYWPDSSTPSSFFSGAVSTSALFSVKHKFLLLLLNLVQGWRVCRADGGWPTKFTVGALGEHGRSYEIWQTMAVGCHVRMII